MSTDIMEMARKLLKEITTLQAVNPFFGYKPNQIKSQPHEDTSVATFMAVLIPEAKIQKKNLNSYHQSDK